tara:strand:- start:577 stop:774 length:198 start_codon:yes stop_codon:yes gene_type:complete
MQLNALLRLPDVVNRTGLSKRSIYRWIANGKFPAQIRIGNSRIVAWSEKDIASWVNQQILSSAKT